MTKCSHYIEGKIIPLLAEGSTMKGDVAFVMTHFMKALHNAVGAGLNVAIAFPEYEDGTKDKRGGLGSKVRVFGTVDDLTKFLVMPEVAILVGQASVRFLGGVKEVPEDVKTWVSFKRDRRQDRRTELYRQRENRRRLGKGKKELYNIDKVSPTPFVSLSSETTGQRFSLFIKRDYFDNYEPSRSPSSYGLGVILPAF